MRMRRRGFLRLAAGAGATLAASARTATLELPGAATDEFVDCDALALAQLVKGGELKPDELVEIVIRRIETLEPAINSISTPCFERARERASQIAGDTVFAGVPVLVKDMIDVGGLPRTDGSRLMLNNVPARNVAYVDGLEKAGMNILAMTNVPEFAQLGITTNNSVFGVTRNPWDLSRSALGSSGGAAAAVAAGIVPMAHGTDGGGSNRLPASANGLFGMKPSHGRMLSGEADGGHSPVKTNQAISRTVRDSAALFAQTEDKSGRFYPPEGLIDEPGTRRLKIGVFSSAGTGVNIDPGVADGLNATVNLLEALGHEVHETQSPVNAPEFFANYNAAFLRRFKIYAELASQRSGRPAAESGLLDPWTVSLIAYGDSIPQEQAHAGQRYLATVAETYDSAFKSFDVLVCPVMPRVSYDVFVLRPSDQVDQEKLAILQDGLSFTASTNVAGVPAMSVPLHWDKETGLPVGTMFQAPRGADRLLYELAYELELARPWRHQWAPISVKFAAAQH